MANFGLTFTFLTSNHNCCGQKDLASKSATKVYAPRLMKFNKEHENTLHFRINLTHCINKLQ